MDAYGDPMSISTTPLMLSIISSTGTTIPDDFLNLYPEDVPENVGNLAGTGFTPGPIFIAAVLLIAIGIASMGARRRRRV